MNHAQEWKPDLELRIKHDDLYARVWECEKVKQIFDLEVNNATAPNSPKNPVKSDLSTVEMWNTPGTAQECFRGNSLQTEQLCDVTDTYPYMEPDVETNSEQPNNCSTNTSSAKNNLHHNPKPNCNDDYRY